MDLADPQKRILPSPDAPGGTQGLLGTSVGRAYGVTAGDDKMRGTMLFDRSGLLTDYPSERGLVDIAADDSRIAGGLINVDKLPDKIKNKLEYPKKAEGGVVSLLDLAQSTGRGPMGINALAPVAREMNRPMVS